MHVPTYYLRTLYIHIHLVRSWIGQNDLQVDTTDPPFPRSAGYWWFGCRAVSKQYTKDGDKKELRASASEYRPTIMDLRNEQRLSQNTDVGDILLDAGKKIFSSWVFIASVITNTSNTLTFCLMSLFDPAGRYEDRVWGWAIESVRQTLAANTAWDKEDENGKHPRRPTDYLINNIKDTISTRQILEWLHHEFQCSKKLFTQAF